MSISVMTRSLTGENMTFRMPQNLTSQLQTNTGASILEAEIFAEHAASLGHHGKLVEAAVKAWEERGDVSGAEAERLLQAAADAVYNYFIQREAVGISNHDHPTKFYRITGPILARLGAM